MVKEIKEMKEIGQLLTSSDGVEGNEASPVKKTAVTKRSGGEGERGIRKKEVKRRRRTHIAQQEIS